MVINEIPDKRKVFVGVECRNDKIKFAIVNYYGKFLTSSLIYFPKDTSKLGERIAYTIRGMRGDANLRMKNFAGIGISFVNRNFEVEDVVRQITQMIAVPVYFDDYESMKQLGQDWINFLGDRTDIPEKSDLSELYVAYGLAKVMKLKTSTNVEAK